jgi:hypothetical protein
MSDEASSGVSVSNVAEAVGGVDAERVETALGPVTDGGIVTRDATEAAVSDTSKLLATAETRIELAGNAYDDAAAMAEPVADIPTVGIRLDAFAERLSAVESRISDLRPDLSIPDDIRRRPVAAYDLAIDIREAVTAAREAVETADDLSFDIEQFQSWVDHPDRRYDVFAEDVDLVVESVDDLEAAADALPDGAADPAARWAAATMRVRVLSLLIDDLRAEHRDLRVLAERNGDPFRDGLGDRLGGVADRASGVESTLDETAEPAWRDRFAADLVAFDEDLEAFEPPVDWGAVDRTLEAHRPDTPAGDR